MDTRFFLHGLEQLGVAFYTGVPDSLLKPLNDTLYADHGLTGAHVVAADEGGAVALAAGHYIATGKPAMVYLQNSGIGNAVNPLASLTHGMVYGIPCVLVVGWRGEPGVHDEPQHAYQGIVSRQMLELCGLTVFELDKATSEADFAAMITASAPLLSRGESIAFLVRKGGRTGGEPVRLPQRDAMTREAAIRRLVQDAAETDYFVSTTGKASRELFELREALGQGHGRDFLTVGSMGHANMIALGMAKARPDAAFWCVDGDGAAMMHLGGLAIEAQQRATNLIHVLLNNGAHESVGDMPVAGGTLRFAPIAQAAGYELALTAETDGELTEALQTLRAAPGKLRFLEIIVSCGARDDLGRPTQTPKENLQSLMQALGK
ncbi:MAG: phosphonopyruvate decarboxylase [Candidatus Limiplasma sp.]|nr:phosphonopyruvate decarboxylase [Candidatus Limiplasma sp.]